MGSMLFLIASITFLATLLGGLFALRFRDRLHTILGFSAGAVMGVVFFDLIPESIHLGGIEKLVFVAVGFAAYLIIDRFLVMHSHHDHGVETGHQHGHKGLFGAGSLATHSFLDGIAIGVAFQASVVIGGVVTIAVIAHDFSDGINTVALILKNGGSRIQAFKFLLVDALAPVVGILVTFLFIVPESVLGIFLAIFAGFFLYIGASDLIPESHHNHPTVWTTAMTILGMMVIFGVIKLAGI